MKTKSKPATYLITNIHDAPFKISKRLQQPTAANLKTVMYLPIRMGKCDFYMLTSPTGQQIKKGSGFREEFF
jgi:hypothetical protein